MDDQCITRNSIEAIQSAVLGANVVVEIVAKIQLGQCIAEKIRRTDDTAETQCVHVEERRREDQVSEQFYCVKATIQYSMWMEYLILLFLFLDTLQRSTNSRITVRRGATQCASRPLYSRTGSFNYAGRHTGTHWTRTIQHTHAYD